VFVADVSFIVFMVKVSYEKIFIAAQIGVVILGNVTSVFGAEGTSARAVKMNIITRNEK
jgi:hypothetical protein